MSSSCCLPVGDFKYPLSWGRVGKPRYFRLSEEPLQTHRTGALPTSPNRTHFSLHQNSETHTPAKPGQRLWAAVKDPGLGGQQIYEVSAFLGGQNLSPKVDSLFFFSLELYEEMEELRFKKMNKDVILGTKHFPFRK